ncbi:MAG: hypothetical protein QG639_946 [Patescibacteria group bacterium]|nr:hypothetical protein [Patescibacteria group bacterium]
MNIIHLKKLPLLLLITLAFLLFTRLYRISEVPTALVHDELIYVMQARSLWLTGSDMSGNWNPLTVTPFNSAFAEFPSILMAPAAFITDNPILNAKIVHILTGMLIPFVLSWFAYGIWKNKLLSVTTLVVASANPWLWQFSRMTFDSLFSVFFYLVGAAIVLTTQKWLRLISVPFFILAFYQYQGLKLILIPFVLLLCAYVFFENKLFIKNNFFSKLNRPDIISLLVITIFSLVLFSYYSFIALPQQTASSRLSQILFLEDEYVASEVTKERQSSLQTPFTSLVSNKYTIIIAGITKNIFKVLNPTFIFFSADEAPNRFVVFNHGYFYIIDFLLLFVGIYLFVKDKQTVKLLFYGLLLLITLIPSVINTHQSFTFRAALFYVLLIPLISYALSNILQNKKWYVPAVTMLLYLLAVINFAYHYFYQYPVYAVDGQFFVERVLSSYINRVPKDTKVIVYGVDQEYLFNSYLFYNNHYNKHTSRQVKQAILDESFTFENVEFRNTCIDTQTLDPAAVMITVADPDICEIEGQSLPKTILQDKMSAFLSVPAVKDSGELYKIFRDPVCNQYDLPTYIAPRSAQLFSVENLDDEQFCENWITDFSPLNTPVQVN